jgi:hypothetical protein
MNEVALLLLSAAHPVELYCWPFASVPYLLQLLLQMPVLLWSLVGLAVRKLVWIFSTFGCECRISFGAALLPHPQLVLRLSASPNATVLRCSVVHSPLRQHV